MKSTVKLLSLLMALLILVSCFAACGGETDTEAGTQGENEGSETEGATVETEPEDPRKAIKDTVPTDLNYAEAENNTITFFVRDDREMWLYEMEIDELRDDTLLDAIYYRTKTVEERLGVTLNTISQPGAYPSTEWNNTLRNCVSTKTGDFQSAAIYASTGSALAVEGVYYNVLDLPMLDLEKPWWNQSIQEETTLFNTLYYLAGDIAITEIAQGYCLFFNKNLLDELYATENLDLYQTVRDKKWTVDMMYDLTSRAWIDENSNGITDDGDTVGMYRITGSGQTQNDSWMAALGVRLTTMTGDGIPELTVYNENSILAFEKFRKLHMDNPGAVPAPVEQTTFQNGKVLMTTGYINGGASFRDMTDSYGILPLAMLDEEQGEYYTGSENAASFVVVLSSIRPDEEEMIGATLEVMAAESYKQVTPAYFEVALKSKYANAPEDAEMYNIILNSFVYSFGFCYSTQSLQGVGSLFRDLSKDFAQTYQSKETAYETALETLIDKLDEISFLQG